MNKHFTVSKDSISIEAKDYSYDLHNCFDFKGLLLTSANNSKLELYFEKDQGDWIKGGTPQKLIIALFNIQYFEVSKNFFINKCRDIERIGYKDKDDHDYDWLLTEEQANIESDIVIRFESDEYLRVNAKEVQLITS